MRNLWLRVVISFMLYFATAQSQGIDNLWMMGYGGGGGGFNFDFSSGTRNINMAPRNLNFQTTSLTYCNEMGNVLFYSNGVYVANALDDTMMNGSGLSPSYYTTVVGWNGLFMPQGALAIPWPNSASKYFLFHNTIDDSIAYSYKQYYSEIDMSLDGGLGAVVSKNNILVFDTLICGRLTAVKHANGRDWWVVFHGGKSDKYYIYLVDPSGINLFNIQRIGGILTSWPGQVCFSPNGSRFALYDGRNDLHLLDFDRCSGVFSNHIHIPFNDNADGGGVAFSSNSQVLYVSSMRYVYQFDMTASNIVSSQTTVAVWDTFYSPSPPAATIFYLAQLAPDNKIYISSQNGVLSMHVIEYPDSLGLACQVCQHCISLPAYNATTIPNHPNYHLGALGSSICDSLNTDIESISFSRNEEYTIFPNPVSDFLYIRKTPATIEDKIKIYNSMLQQLSISTTTINNGEYLEFNTENLLPGVYFLEIDSKKGRVLKKFIKA